MERVWNFFQSFFDNFDYARVSTRRGIIIMPAAFGLVLLVMNCTEVLHTIPFYGRGFRPYDSLAGFIYFWMSLALHIAWQIWGYTESFSHRQKFLKAFILPFIPLAVSVLIGCSEVEFIKNIPFLQEAARYYFSAAYYTAIYTEFDRIYEIAAMSIPMGVGLSILIKYTVLFTSGYLLGIGWKKKLEMDKVRKDAWERVSKKQQELEEKWKKR